MKSAFFITFSGNCKEALTFYQSCFGGRLQFEDLDTAGARPIVVLGSLIADNITIHGSDLVHDEGRIFGNHIAVFLQFENRVKRRNLINKLLPDFAHTENENLTMIEALDPYYVRLILAI